MAFALAPAAAAAVQVPRVDIESLLWELRDLLRGLGQVNTAPATQLAVLSASLPTDSVSAEYAERTRAALDAVDVALDQLQFPTEDEAEDEGLDDEPECDNSRIHAWLHETRMALSEPEQPSFSAPVAEPTDFWSTDSGFKWDEEPESDDAVVPSEAFEVLSLPDDSFGMFEDDAVGPWDSISVREISSEHDSDSGSDADSDSWDESEEAVRRDGSSGDDSDTLFYSEPRPDFRRPPINTAAKKLDFGLSSSPQLDVFALRPLAVLEGF